MLNIVAPGAKWPTVWKCLNFWRDCFSLPGTVLAALGGGEGFPCHIGMEAAFPEQAAHTGVLSKELTHVVKQNARVPTAHSKHSGQYRNADAEKRLGALSNEREDGSE